jgi:TolA-binding protein
MIDKNTPIRSLPINWSITDALICFGLPQNTYEHAVKVTDAELLAVHGIGPARLYEWKHFKANNPISNPLTEAETLKLEVEQLRTQLDSRQERISELNGQLAKKETETQNLVWHNQSLTYRLNQMHKMLDLVRNGLTVPELRRIGFTVDISIAKEETPNDPHTN